VKPRNLNYVTMLLLFATACGQQQVENSVSKEKSDEKAANYYAALDSDKKVLMLWTSSPTDSGFTGNIPAGIKIDSPIAKAGSFEKLVLALASCGEVRVVVDLGFSHTEIVSVPIAENNPLREQQTDDLALVRCVQKRVTFDFDAGYGTSADPGFGSTDFESLYAQKK